MKIFNVALSVLFLLATGTPVRTDEQRLSISIYNGYPARSWPSHGALFHRPRPGEADKKQSSYQCGVTILSEWFVITAAHCTIDHKNRKQPLLSADRVFVKVGLSRLNPPEQKSIQQHNVSRIIRHEEFYFTGDLENDIALLKLNTTITFTSHVQPISVWEGNLLLKNNVSKIGYIVGWGNHKFTNYQPSNDLIEATVPIVSKKECIYSDLHYYRYVYFENKTFCGGYRNGTTAAPGDSGGGLYLWQGEVLVLRGLVSNIREDSSHASGIDPNSYMIFTDVVYYLPWIKSHMNKNNQDEILSWALLICCVALACTPVWMIVVRHGCRKKKHGYLIIDDPN